MRNAIYTGEWLTDSKRHFSKTGYPAYGLASDYMSGSCIRQDYLETVLDWISEGNIEKYMADHQLNVNANELWLYFTSVINWVKTIFPKYRKEMKGIEWGYYFNKYKNNNLDTKKMDEEVTRLMQDDDIGRKSGK